MSLHEIEPIALLSRIERSTTPIRGPMLNTTSKENDQPKLTSNFELKQPDLGIKFC